MRSLPWLTSLKKRGRTTGIARTVCRRSPPSPPTPALAVPSSAELARLRSQAVRNHCAEQETAATAVRSGSTSISRASLATARKGRFVLTSDSHIGGDEGKGGDGPRRNLTLGKSEPDPPAAAAAATGEWENTDEMRRWTPEVFEQNMFV